MTANASSTKETRLDANETTPLIAASAAGPTAQANEEPILEPTKLDVDDDTPLPKWQIVLLCYARMVEPIAVRWSLLKPFEPTED